MMKYGNVKNIISDNVSKKHKKREDIQSLLLQMNENEWINIFQIAIGHSYSFY